METARDHLVNGDVTRLFFAETLVVREVILYPYASFAADIDDAAQQRLSFA
jgi:hypothetical protein